MLCGKFMLIRGVYVDVGANDTINGSVTKALYLAGWRGVNIEPLEDKFKDLVKDRPEDVSLNMGISNEPGIMRLLRADDLSTIDEDTQKEVLRLFKDKVDGFSEVKIDTLDNVYESLDILKKNEVIFCKIDVEGLEDRVISGINFEKYRPWLFCIEFRGTEKWEPMLIENGYEFVMEDVINRWYVDKQHKEIKNRIHKGEELARKYQVYQVLRYEDLRELRKPKFKDRLLKPLEKSIIGKVIWVIRHKGVIVLMRVIRNRIRRSSI